jgi:hypothetical protein
VRMTRRHLWISCVLLVLVGCGAELATQTPALQTRLPSSPPATTAKAGDPAETSPSHVPECGYSSGAIVPVRPAAGGARAVFSSPSGVSMYDVESDRTSVLAEATSRFGTFPHFLTRDRVSYVQQRDTAPEGPLWGEDSVFLLDTSTAIASEMLVLPNHILGHAWSPTGEYLAYQIRAETATEQRPVALCLFEGSSGSTSRVRLMEAPLGTGTGQREETRVSWAPSGQSLLVVDTAESPSLAVVDLEGRDLLAPTEGTFARWLSDDKILYQTQPHTDNPSKWLVVSISTGTTELFDLPERAYRPSLSPDGTRLVFDDGLGKSPSIFLADIETQKSRRLAGGFVGGIWLNENLIAATAVRECVGNCVEPWSNAGSASGIDPVTGAASRLALPTTLQEYTRYGGLDVAAATD